MLTPRRARGFSLIELLITLAVLSVLLMAVAPAMGSWIADARVRSTAEALQNGLRLAQGQALQRNRHSVFALTSATPAWNARPVAGGSNWYVQVLPLAGSDEGESATAAAFFVQGNAYATQSSVSISGPALLCFNALGQQVALEAAATGLGAACTARDPATYIVSSPSHSGSRTLQVRAYPGGRVRMCDPARNLSSEQPDGC